MKKEIEESFRQQMKCIEKAYEFHRIDEAY